jgi:hypothetical protein
VKWTFLTGRAPEHEVRELKEDDPPSENPTATTGPAPNPPKPQPEGHD